MEKQEIIKAIIEFQSKVPKLELNSNVDVKLKSGGKYSFKYADLPYIMEVIQETLTLCKLAVYYQISELQISIVIAHESGQFIMSSLPLQFGTNPQENGSLISYYKRYLLTSVLNLVAEQDDDANVSLDNDFSKKSNKPWLNQNTKEWTNAYDKLKSGTITMDTIKKNYRISGDNELILKELTTK